MKSISLIFILCLYQLHTSLIYADDKLYEKFLVINKDLSDKQAVISFIKEDNNLSDRLSKNYQIYLGKHKKWEEYLQYYTHTSNPTRLCYYLTALYFQGHHKKALRRTKTLWLSGSKKPKACIELFNIYLSNASDKSDIVWQRLKNIIKLRNYSFAAIIKKNLNPTEQKLVEKWIKLSKTPQLLSKINIPHNNHGAIIVTNALFNWISRDFDQSLKFWQKNKKVYPFTKKQKKIIYQRFSLYAALRNRPDANAFFKKLNIATTPAIYLEWQVRYAIAQADWLQVRNLITKLPPKVSALNCWQYWLAKAMLETGDKDNALAILNLLSDKSGYYAILASYQIAEPINFEHKTYQYPIDHLEDLQKQLSEINLTVKAKNFKKANLMSYELVNGLSKAGKYQLAQQYAKWQWHDKALYLATISGHSADLGLNYPLAHMETVEKLSEKFKVDKALIYAVIKQESQFRIQVKSKAGAVGLMQLMPSTAKAIAKQYDLPFKKRKHLLQEKANLHLGIAYLSHLAKRFDNHPLLMTAAYNAGPSQVDKWLKNNKFKSVDIWIETLPWRETRNYIKKIIASYAIYKYRLNETSTIERFMRDIDDG